MSRPVGSKNKKQGLSMCETETFKLIMQGLTNTQIAMRLQTSPQVIKNRVSDIYAKKKVHSRAELIINEMNATIKEITDEQNSNASVSVYVEGRRVFSTTEQSAKRSS